MNITSPCHGSPLLILTTSEGPSYMQSNVPSEILCKEAGCFNSWNAEGVADPWNKMPEEK